MADTYSPTSGMKAAARRALKWKEDGKATGAGTPVGWGRATDIVNGSAMSLDTVKRMYSFFSRHEVDKKGKGFFDGPEFPSNGRIMWDAWGGDAVDIQFCLTFIYVKLNINITKINYFV